MMPVVVIEIPGVPPNWSNERMHYMAKHSTMKAWREKATFLARGARAGAGWPTLDKRPEVEALRFVSFTLYKHEPLYDDDGAWSSIKPLLDALQGVLIWKDSPKWVGIREVKQVPIPKKKKECTIIQVSLV
jgi:hypothetical protein